MYNTEVFETAMQQSGYTLEAVFYGKNRMVNKIQGSATVVRRTIVNGEPHYSKTLRLLRWDNEGHCFSFYSNTRLRHYDLALEYAANDLKKAQQ